MTTIEAVKKIKEKFREHGNPTQIPLQRGRRFNARMTPKGISVDNLGNQPLLTWEVFQEAVCVLQRNGGRSRRGNAMNFRLGEQGLPVDSIEGHIAFVVYGKQKGDFVFRRIAPIAAILVWARICRASPGELILLDL
jgi:hypothetical protein